jgi:hypothetical protein
MMLLGEVPARHGLCGEMTRKEQDSGIEWNRLGYEEDLLTKPRRAARFHG